MRGAAEGRRERGADQYTWSSAEWARLRCAAEPALALGVESSGATAGAPREEPRNQLWREGQTLPAAASAVCAPLLPRLLRRFGITDRVELFACKGYEDPAVARSCDPILLSLPAALLALCGEVEVQALIGAAVGRHIAHGPMDLRYGAARIAMERLQSGQGSVEEQRRAAQLMRARRMTAERYGLMACGELDAMLRLQLAELTGLPCALTASLLPAYRAQCNALLAEGGELPDHVLRYAALCALDEALSSGAAMPDLVALERRCRPWAEAPAALSGALWALPPAHVLELSAAASVLVAASDGPLTAFEREDIAAVYAELLPDWRPLLVPEVALQRFQALAPLLPVEGMQAQHAVLLLCAHTLFARGPAAPQERDLLLAIGVAIGAGAWFARGLGAHLALIDPQARLAPMPRQLVPPGSDTAPETLLLSVFESAARCRIARLSPRRLLRVLGEDRLGEAVAFVTAAAASRAGLVLQLGPGLALDRQLRVGLPSAADAARISISVTGLKLQAEQAMESAAAMTVLRRQLGLLSASLSAVAAPPSGLALGQLDLLAAGRGAQCLSAIVQRQPVVVLAASEASRHRALTHRLHALQARQEHALEREGRSALALGYPMLLRPDGVGLLGPLLLHPVRLRAGVGNAAIMIQPPPAQPLRVYRGLLCRLLAERGQSMDADLTRAIDAAAVQGLAALLRLLAARGLRLAPLGQAGEGVSACLGPQALLAEWHEGDEPLTAEYEALCALATPSEAGARLGAAAELLPGGLRRALVPAGRPAALPRVLPPLAATPGQLRVLEQARAQRCLLVETPPASGAPTLLANVVCEALARGERVALCSAVPATLEALRRRLEALGLGPVGVYLEGAAEATAALAPALRQRLESEPLRADPGFRIAALDAEIAALEGTLDSALARLRQPLGGLSRAQLEAKLAALPLAPLETPPSGLDRLGAEPLESLIRGVQRLWPDLPLLRPGSAWGLPRPELADLDAEQARQRLEALQDLVRLRAAWSQACADAALDERRESYASLLVLEGFWSAAERLLALHAQWGPPTFDALLAAAWPTDPQAAGLDAALQALQLSADAADAALERAGLGRSALEDPFTTLEQTEDALRAALARRPLRERADTRERFVNLMRAAQNFPESLQLLEQARGLWKRHAAALERWPDSPRFEGSEALDLAMRVIESGIGDHRRWTSQEWWRSVLALQKSLRQYWPERRYARPDADLIDEVRARIAATEAWHALDAAATALGAHALPSSAVDAARWLAAMGETWDQVARLRARQEPLATLGAWPESMIPRSLQAWDERVQDCLAALEAERSFRRALGEWAMQRGFSAVVANRAGLDSLRELAVLRARFDERRAALESLRLWPAPQERWEQWSQQLARCRAAAVAGADFERALSELHAWLPGYEPWPAAASLEMLVESWRRDAGPLQRLDRRRRRLRALLPDLDHLLHLLVEQGAPRDWADRLRRSWCEAVLVRHDDASGLDFEAAERRLGELHAERAALSGQAARLRQDRAPILRHDAAAVVATRKALLEDAGRLIEGGASAPAAFIEHYWKRGLGEWLPLWMCGPRTALELLPPAPLFDLLIVDEAAQIDAAKGFLLLRRAQRAILLSGADALAPAGRRTAASGAAQGLSLWAMARQYLEPLVLGQRVEAAVPELLSFADRAWPPSALQAAPAVSCSLPPGAARWERLSGAVEQAQRAVERLHDLLASGQTSVALVVGEEPLRRAVASQLQRRLARDHDFARAYLAAQAHPEGRPVVRAAADLAGFACDHLVLLPGAPDAVREAQLEAALRGTRRSFALISAWDARLLATTPDEGRWAWVWMRLHRYVEALQQEQPLAALRELDWLGPGLPDEAAEARTGLPLRLQIAMRLRAEGLCCALDVGAEPYRVGLAVVDPRMPGRYALGLRCDEDWTLSADSGGAWLRHVHVPAALRARGWRLRTVQAAQWRRAPERVIATIRAALDATPERGPELQPAMAVWSG